MTIRDPRWVFKERPSVGLIVGLVLAGLCALASFSFDLLDGEPVRFVIALILAIAPVPLLLAAVLGLDRLEPEPRSNLIFAFAWGAGIAVLAAGIINSVGLLYISHAANLELDDARGIAATFGAPLVEETMKGLVLLGLLRFRRQELDGPTDGIIYASMVGLGFAMSENVSYYVAAQSGPVAVQSLAVTVVLRGVLSPFAHPLFTSMIGVAVAWAAHRHGPGRVFILLAGWVGAMLLHGLWNGLATYGGFPGLVVAYLVLMAVLFTLIGLVIRDRRRIVALLQRYLPPYEPTGLISGADVTMLSSLPARRHARQWSKAHGGRAGLRAMSDYQLAATELGLLHERASRGGVGESVFYEEQRALLECMRAARASLPAPPSRVVRFGPQQPPQAPPGQWPQQPSQPPPGQWPQRPSHGPYGAGPYGGPGQPPR
ncbi:RsiW-degrading membrane proteinase PrsW (M82 family) [Thermocatellispora tengchongensis]|uniref:RsiW-degrading membrane proteinase PrsW (M82 family) n=1 Tax=Thermocatellispora tengchongensis TaxID=1073253 RepID=A0A840PAC1_9ACTN|nr:PrsW family intramembrane metalloprotease [Thermocatellispora tengchongensis]MBB5135949.1 RsiW-degrading membrane proteinase PrsW (M82 family) [Thermocatellispora tengchongensis]